MSRSIGSGILKLSNSGINMSRNIVSSRCEDLRNCGVGCVGVDSDVAVNGGGSSVGIIEDQGGICNCT